MSKSLVLECRQKDSLLVNQNGDYETNFRSGVVEINTGDVITLKSAYIDTTFQNQYNFVNDIILNIEFGVYISDWSRGQDKTGYVNDNPEIDTDFCTGAIYSPYKVIKGGELDPNIYQLVSELNYWVSSLNAQVQSYTFVFNYLDYNNVPRQIVKGYPAGYFNNGTYSDIVVTDKTTPFIIRKGSLKPDGETQNVTFAEAGLDVNKGYWFPTFTNATSNFYEPYVFNTEIIIPAGSYTPENIGQILTEKIASNKSTNNAGVFNNKFIFPVNVFDVGKPDPENPDEVIQEEVFFYNQTGYNLEDPLPDGSPTGDPLINGFYFNPNSPTLIGATQITFQYDTIAQKIQLLYSYMPMYDATDGVNISCYYLRQGSDYEEQHRRGNIFTCARHSGIYFTGLSAKDSVTNRPLQFWQNLGFDLGTLCATKQTIGDGLITKFGDEGIWSYYDLKDGINVTNGYVGIDSAIKKGQTWMEVATVPDDSDSGIVATIQASTIINSNLSIPQIFTPYSHFLISCDLNYTTDYYGADSMWTKISAIVSRYYAYGTYTSGDGAQSIQYQHYGAPIYLKNCRVRIMKPDKTIDQNLGEDNTVMMEIIKPLPQPQPQQIKKK